jgi:hypothetical protein
VRQLLRRLAGLNSPGLRSSKPKGTKVINAARAEQLASLGIFKDLCKSLSLISGADSLVYFREALRLLKVRVCCCARLDVTHTRSALARVCMLRSVLDLGVSRVHVCVCVLLSLVCGAAGRIVGGG